MPQCFPAPSLSLSDREEQVPGRGRRLRLLAYGDSLTAGYYDHGDRFLPYASVLAELLAPDFDVEVWVCGLSSFTASRMVQGLAQRSLKDGVGRRGQGLQAILAEKSSSSNPFFDLVLLMAGTNDLASKSERAVRICNNIKALHAVCHEYNVPTVALSVPPNAVMALQSRSEQKKAYKVRWNQLQEQLEAWATGAGAREGVAQFVDTQQLVPFSEDSGYWEADGLHLSPEGSRQLGRGLASQLGMLLRGLVERSLRAPQPDAPGPWRRADRPMPELIAPPTPTPEAVPEAAAARRRILAYGDSLTAGFYACGNLFEPYAEALVSALSPRTLAEAWVCGLSGLTAEEMAKETDAEVLRDCTKRRGKGLRRILKDHGRFDLVIIMAGTNDLGDIEDAFDPAEVVDSVGALHEACHEAHVPTVLLTLPSCRAAEKEILLEKRRRRFNKQLREWAAGHQQKTAGVGGGEAAGVALVVEAAELLPYSEESGMWEADGLHFTRAGSRRFGTRLAEKLGAYFAAG